MTWLWRFAAWIVSWFVRAPHPYRTILVEELPEHPDESTLYLVGESGHLWIAAMVCPCGCGQLIQLNLLRSRRPSWRVDQHADRTVSLHPSVWRTAGCRSHFWFRRGRVDWCADFEPVEATEPDAAPPQFDRYA